MNVMSRTLPPVRPDEAVRPWRPERCDRVALVFQGGGALGAYHALHERLQEFWSRITERRIWRYTPEGDLFRHAHVHRETD